jgi:hypothetical protein
MQFCTYEYRIPGYEHSERTDKEKIKTNVKLELNKTLQYTNLKLSDKDPLIADTLTTLKNPKEYKALLYKWL